MKLRKILLSTVIALVVCISALSSVTNAFSGDLLPTDSATSPCEVHASVTGLSPSSGSVRGGTLVSITGTCFDRRTLVTFGSDRYEVSLVSSTLIRVSTTEHAAETIDVSVTFDGASRPIVLEKAFTFRDTDELILTYSGNGNTKGNPPVDEKRYKVGEMARVLEPADLDKEGYTFSVWSTNPDPKIGRNYRPGEEIEMLGDTVLYALWTAIPPPPTTHTVTYALGGGTGTLPTQAAVAEGSSFIVASASTISRTGYTFNNWSDGTTGYAPGASYTMGTSNVTLTATWTVIPTHVIIFNSNGGIGTMANQVSTGPTVIASNAFTRSGYAFYGWMSSPTGGIHYEVGDIYSFVSDLTLYAEWTLIPTGGNNSPAPAAPTPIVHQVSFDGNGAADGVMAVQSASTPTALNKILFTRPGYIFEHWSTNPAVDGTLYSNGEIFNFSTDVILYAHWGIKAFRSVTFESNGAIPSGSVTQRANQRSVLAANSFARIGYTFNGWTSLSNGSGQSFSDGATFDFDVDLVLYAQWLLIPIIPTVISESTPLDLALLSNESKTLHVAIPAQNGTQIPATIDVPSGIVGVNGSIRITPVTSSDSLALGIVTIKVEILDSFGSVIPTLLAPMTIHFKNAAGENIVAQSNDGFFWTAIPKLSGTTLPSGVTAGYYLDSDGAIVILTSHLTQFGLKRKQIAPFQVTSSAAAISNLGTTSLTTSGGSGSGAVRFSTSTPSVCTVDTNGILIPVASGKCLVSATKGGDAIYLHSDSSEIGINISSSGKVLSIKGSTTRKSIFINLSSANSGKTVSVQVKTGTLTTFKTVSKLVLNEIGRISSTVIAPKGSTIRVMVGSKVFVTMKVAS